MRIFNPFRRNRIATSVPRLGLLGPASASQPGWHLYESEIMAAVDGAMIVSREPNDDGLRIYVVSPSLRGSFLYTREEAERWIKRAFQGIDKALIRRALRHLENRVRKHAGPTDPAAPPSWLHGWAQW